MADQTNKATVTPAASVGVSPTTDAGAATTPTAPILAETWEDSLDRQGAALAAQAQANSGDKTQAEDQAAETEEADADKTAETTEEPAEQDTEAEDTETTETETEEADETATEAPAGKFEKGVLKELTEKGISPALQKRIASLFKKEPANRQAIADRDAILTTKDGEIETLKTQLAEAGTKATTIAPSGPLAHLDTLEKLQAATDMATQNLQWAETRRDFDRYFQDDDTVDEGSGRTAEQKFQDFKAQQLWILSNQAKQTAILIKREEIRKALKKSKPELFIAENADSKAFVEFYATDPRTREDADEVARLYLKAKKQEEEEATGNFKYHRIDIKAAKANGAIASAKTTSNGSSTVNVLPVTMVCPLRLLAKLMVSPLRATAAA